MAGRKENMAPMWKKLMNNCDLDGPPSFLDHENLGCTQRECKLNENIVEEYNKVFESRISAKATEKLFDGRNLTQKRSRGRMIWKVMRRSAWKDIANWQKKAEQLYKSLLHARTAITSKRKNWKRSENCPRYAHNLS